MEKHYLNHLDKKISDIDIIIEETTYPGEKFDDDCNPVAIDDEATFNNERTRRIDTWKSEVFVILNHLNQIYPEVEDGFRKVVEETDDYNTWQEYLNELL